MPTETQLSFDIGKVTLLAGCVFKKKDWVLDVSLQGHASQQISCYNKERTVLFELKYLTENPTICFKMFGPIEWRSLNAKGTACTQTGGWMVTGFLHKTIDENWKGGTINLHDPSMTACAHESIMTVSIVNVNNAAALKGETVRQLRMAERRSLEAAYSYSELNQLYINHWSKLDPIDGENILQRIHSPFFWCDGKLLPITYWIRKKIDIPKDTKEIRNYFENALRRVIESSAFENEASFINDCEEFVASGAKADKEDMLRVVGELILFRCRFITYAADVTIIRKCPTELYMSPSMPYEEDTADCEDCAKECQLMFILLKELYHGTELRPPDTMFYALSILDYYTVAICQGAVSTADGSLTNHMWSCLIPRTEVKGMFEEPRTTVTPPGLHKLILEGTSASTYDTSEDVLLFLTTNSKYPSFYRYVLDIHIHQSESECLPNSVGGSCTDFILVNKGTSPSYGMRIENFFKHASAVAWKKTTLEPAVYVTDRQAKLATRDNDFMIIGKCPTLPLGLTTAGRPMKNRQRWLRVKTPTKRVGVPITIPLESAASVKAAVPVTAFWSIAIGNN